MSRRGFVDFCVKLCCVFAVDFRFVIVHFIVQCAVQQIHNKSKQVEFVSRPWSDVRTPRDAAVVWTSSSSVPHISESVDLFVVLNLRSMYKPDSIIHLFA